MIVVDTNIIVYLFLPSQHTEQAEQLLLQEPVWSAPFLWRSEFRNVLAGYLRKNLISLEEAFRLQAEAESFLHGNEFLVPSSDVLQLVRDSACSAYDCEFVALAQGLGTTLVTGDRKVLREFPDIATGIEATS